MAGFGLLNCTGMKHTASVRKNSSARGTSTRSRKPAANGRRFAVCVQNDGYEASLERNKIYLVLPDKDAESDEPTTFSKAASHTIDQVAGWQG
jgi:hypothetical protein